MCLKKEDRMYNCISVQGIEDRMYNCIFRVKRTECIPVYVFRVGGLDV